MRSGRNGAVLIEFGLIAGVLILLVAGLADASGALRAKQVLRMAAREGGRVASVTPGLVLNDSRVITRVTTILQDNRLNLGSSVTVLAPEGIAVGQPVVVAVTHQYEPIFLDLVPGFQAGLPLQASATMRYEGGPTS